MAFIAKELSRFVTREGQKVKGTFYSIAVEDMAGGPFFSIPVKAKRVIFKALIVLNKVIIAVMAWLGHKGQVETSDGVSHT